LAKIDPAEEVSPDPVIKPSLAEDEDVADPSDAFLDDDPAPSEEEMAAYLGSAGSSSETGNDTEVSDGSLPTLEEAVAMVPAKAKALMEELFRARLEKVKRIDPKEIR